MALFHILTSHAGLHTCTPVLRSTSAINAEASSCNRSRTAENNEATDNSSPHIRCKVSADIRHTFPNVPHTPSTHTMDSVQFAVSDTGPDTFDTQQLAPASTQPRAIP